jgi:hypothetical protein
LYWADLAGRTRKDFLGSSEVCYRDARIEDSRRWVLYHETSSKGPRIVLWDRKTGKVASELPDGCAEGTFAASGTLYAARCPRGFQTPGVYLVPAPADR